MDQLSFIKRTIKILNNNKKIIQYMKNLFIHIFVGIY